MLRNEPGEQVLNSSSCNRGGQSGGASLYSEPARGSWQMKPNKRTGGEGGIPLWLHAGRAWDAAPPHER